jgi:anti-sigma B factor antagonist
VRPVEFEQRAVAESVVVIRVLGDLDIGSADALRDVLDGAEVDDPTVVRLDASQVEFLDSTALGVILACAQRLDEHGGRFELANPSPAVKRILEMTLISRTVHLIP